MKATKMLNDIKTLLNIEVNLEEMKLENGTVITTDALEKGNEVFIVTDDEKVAIPVGEYILEDGKLLIVEEEGIIADVRDVSDDVPAKEEAEEEPKDETEDLEEEADVADWKGMEKRIKNLEDAIADLKADKENKMEKEDDPFADHHFASVIELSSGEEDETIADTFADTSSVPPTVSDFALSERRAMKLEPVERDPFSIEFEDNESSPRSAVESNVESVQASSSAAPSKVGAAAFPRGFLGGSKAIESSNAESGTPKAPLRKVASGSKRPIVDLGSDSSDEC